MSTCRKALSGCAAAAAGTTIWITGAHAATTHHGVAGQHPSVKHVTVTGHLETIGGPAPGTPRPLSGTVSWSGRSNGTVDVAADGGFALSLAPGHYELTGHSPQYGDGTYLCQSSKPLVVQRAEPAHLDVYCQMR
jgi:hypothetical protein